MARLLLYQCDMRILSGCSLVVVALLLFVPATSFAQETRPPDGTPIKSAEISGLDLARLSPGLQSDLRKLPGTALDRQLVRELAARIEAEQPRFVAAPRITADADGGARVVFVVARMSDLEQAVNINTKYVVEDVRIRGVAPRDITPEMRVDQEALTGKPLDADLADRLEGRLRSAFPDYNVERRTGKGSQAGHVRLFFLLARTEESRWLRFETLEANAVYHSDQGWGAKLPLTMSSRTFMVVPHFAFDVGDDLIEEYSGGGLRFESRQLGTDRLGVFFDWSSFRQTWRDETVTALAANPAIAPLYRNRRTVTPLLKFAITKHLTFAGGVSIAELDPVDEAVTGSEMANAAIGSVRFTQQWKQDSRVRHALAAAFTVRAGTETLESDYLYRRYTGQAGYMFRHNKHHVLVSGMAGAISGDAPLFERFSLGDSRTLRGWSKYEIAPLGGDRVFHAAAEYRYRGLAVFLDSGSVWDKDAERRVRFSTGFGFTPGPVFFLVGFPINTSDSRAVFTMGLRFSTSALSFRKD
jgi:hypothetical protein